MKELKRIEELVRIHRQKKRKKLILASGIGAVLLCVTGGTLYLTRDSWLKPSTSGKAAVILTENRTESSDTAETIDASNHKVTDSEITISLMGDCTLGTDESFSFDTSLNAYYLYRGAEYFFENVKTVLAEDDLSIVNLEGVLTDSTARNGELYAFKGDPEFVDILTEGSIEAANLANNHSHDYGEDSFLETQKVLSEADITSFGYDETALVEVKGIKVGLVGIYELRDHLERMQQLEKNIDLVKSKGADLIIVVFHWGNERETIPDHNQMTLGHAAIDLGANLVVGHHSHVLQGIEEYRDKYIVYSLGNFCFGGNTAPADMDTMIFQQTFTFKDGDLQTDDNINIVPCRITSEWGFNNYQPTPAEGEESDRILEKINERSEQITGRRL